MSESQLPLDRATMEPRRVSDSQVLMSLQMNPADANPSGNVHGGTIMKLVDTAAGVCAMRHCRTRVVTVTMDSMSFLHPVYVGNVVSLYASVNDVGGTSLEVGVRVEAENIQIHGGIGFTWEHPAHLYFKRAKSSEILLGDATYHRELLAQRIGI